MSELMKIVGLRKNYGLNSGIENVNMRVSTSTIHGFLGLNGSGKTTTMKIIMGLLRRDGGSIEFQGEEYDPENLIHRARIGFSTDIPYFPPYLTGEELLLSYGKIRSSSGRGMKFDTHRLLKLVNLDDQRNKKIGKYSRGMLSRLGIAVSLIGDPEMMILDEPTSGLDPAAAVSVRDLLGDLRREGKTILLSSHLLGEVQEMCQAVTIIHKGETMMEGSIEDISKKFSHNNNYTIQFNGMSDELVSEIEHIYGIKDIRILDKSSNVLDISASGENDLREIIAKTAVKNGVLMISFVKDKQSLEDLFLKLVSDYNGHKN